MEAIRSFVAIELPPDVLSALGRLQGSLQADSPPGVKWVDAKSIHLTLKFLGGVPASRLELVSAALAKVAQAMRPLTLVVKGLGVFPDARRPRVAWVGLEGDVDRLAQLQQAIDTALTPLGFAKEDRPFVPHLTLARLREDMPPPERAGFGQRYLAAHLEPLVPFKVDSLNLMKSQLTPRGAVYSRLGKFDFAR